MLKFLTVVISLLFANLTTKGQNLFLIDEKSYPCTNAIVLKSNSEGGEDLQVFIAKDGKAGLFAVSTISRIRQEFAGKLIIYLEDGTVLTCNDIDASEEVDDRAIALYSLTDEQLNKLKSSNIHTVKYTLVFFDEVKYSASNHGIKTNTLISEFFNPTEKLSNIDYVANNPPGPTALQDPDAEKPFAYVEQMPTFPNGHEDMYKYIYEKLEYPASARENGISGQVIVQFVVSESGAVQNAKVIRGIGGGCNEEALRIVNSMPKWNPGKHNGQNVAVTFTLPIKFVL